MLSDEEGREIRWRSWISLYEEGHATTLFADMARMADYRSFVFLYFYIYDGLMPTFLPECEGRELGVHRVRHWEERYVGDSEYG
jgi:hypothetical protein